jgi:RimJ/RimL family protein N-acetyltransferase
MEARIESFNELKEWDIFTPEASANLINISDELKICEWRIDRIKRRESVFYDIFLHDAGRFLGSCSLTKCDWNENKAMLGFWLRTSETGKGYAAEAAKALLEYGINVLGLKIYSMHAMGNRKSQAVLLNLGFKQRRIEQALPHVPGGDNNGIYYDYFAKH